MEDDGRPNLSWSIWGDEGFSWQSTSSGKAAPRATRWSRFLSRALRDEQRCSVQKGQSQRGPVSSYPASKSHLMTSAISFTSRD